MYLYVEVCPCHTYFVNVYSICMKVYVNVYECV